MEYALYLESGPRRRKTMVHALDLLGCTAQGPTTEAALEAMPKAIRAYLRFLWRHGEAVEPEAEFTTVVAEHITEGVWLGNGDPTPGFGPDFQPLSAGDLAVYLRRLAALRADLLALIRDVPQAQLIADPETGGRSIFGILEHVAESQCVYLRYLVGKVDGLSEALRAVHTGPEDLPAALGRLFQISSARLEILTEAERTQTAPHGQVIWTARRALRRMLEHDWEHLGELTRRLLICCDVAAFDWPVLLLNGELSPRVFHLINAELARCLPRATRAVILHTLHAIHVGNPKAYNATVLEFFARR